MTSNRNDFIEYNELATSSKMFIANEQTIFAIANEAIKLTKLLSDDIEISVKFIEVLHVSKLNASLFSTITFIKFDDVVMFEKKKCTLYDKQSKQIVLHSFKSRNQYSFNLIKQKAHYVAYSIVLYSSSKYSEKAMQL